MATDHGRIPQRQRGIALITVILIVALATTVASFVAWRQQVWTRQVENLRDAAQAAAVARAGVDWAGAILSEDRRKNQTDHLNEAWAQQVALPVERGRVAGGILDAQARFNLNNLVRNGQASLTDIAAFQRLLTTLEFSADAANRLTEALIDWLDADNLPYGAAIARAPITWHCRSRIWSPTGLWSIWPNSAWCAALIKLSWTSWRPGSACCRCRRRSTSIPPAPR